VTDILARAQSASRTRAPFAMFDTSIQGVFYQTLVYLMYEGGPDAKLSAAAGFMVDMAWVKVHYFSDFIQQIHEIVNDPSVSITISDEKGRVVAAVGPPIGGGPTHVRTFQLVFADPALVADLARTERAPSWTARVGVAREGALAAASRGATRTLVLAGLASSRPSSA
jgi:hypothetical protein